MSELESAVGSASPVLAPEDDFDLDADIDWLVREIDAGRQQVPPETAVEGPAISLSLGDACDVDPALLVAMCGPDGLGGQSLSAAFGQDQAADVLRPGPVLAALTAQQVPGPGSPADPGSLSDDQLIGTLQAARRLANLADYQQTRVIAEFARRRQAQFEAAQAAGKPAGCRDGEFPGEELTMELVETAAYTGSRIDTALELTSRLPRTLADMAAGTIDLGRAMTIAARTITLTDAGAAYADEVLAAAAPGCRPDQLARKAAALEMKLAPDAVRARKELARHLDQRVEARREESGNASLAGRELDTADVIASKAYIDAIALQLRDSGHFDATLPRLRALALVDLTQGRDPLSRIKPAPGPAPARHAPQRGEGPGRAPGDTQGTRHDGPETSHDEAADGPGESQPGESQHGKSQPSQSQPSQSPVPLPALINILVPAGTLLGWGTAPAHAGGWGLLDADETTTLLNAASQHPRTRWCTTIVAPDGTAIAHGCAPGQRPWPPTGSPPGDPPQARQLLDLLHHLNTTLHPIARDTCAHTHAEDRYVPSRKLKHLLRARNQTCTAPACNAQAVYCDIDHTVPYPDGPSCECNTNPKCRRHHRTKQAPGWETAQPAPDTATWTTPAGRTHLRGATVYDL
jgi:hypothetical protein